MIDNVELETPGTYYVSNSADVNIYKMVVTEEENTSTDKTEYKITVNDEKAEKQKIEENKTEGSEYTLKASNTENFIYWVNSYGRIVSRDAEYSFPVYYSDTYTAVYKSAETTYKFMTAYNQVYETYTSSNLAIPTAPVKYGYEFDYWKIGETKVSTVKEIKDAGTGTDVEIKPVYKEITGNVSITINGVTKDDYKRNEIVIADATTLENFMYWYLNNDESKILSYNDLYYFYADDKVNSVTAKCGTDTVTKGGIITHITNISDGNNKTYVFEYTVPDGCKIVFAGIVASSSSEPTLTNYEYIRGGSSDTAKTYRYSWTKTDAASITWNVRPVLKYSDEQGKIVTIDTADVQKY